MKIRFNQYAAFILIAQASFLSIPAWSEERVLYQGFNDATAVPTDMEWLSMMPRDDHDCRSRVHKQDVVPRRSHGPSQRIVLSTSSEAVLSGSRLSVELENEMNSQTAKVGDTIQGKLLHDFYAYNVLVAPKGATVFGKVSDRTESADLLGEDGKKGLRGVKIVFDALEGVAGDKIEFHAIPATETDIERGPEHARVYSVSENGYVAAKTDGLPFNGGRFGFTTGKVRTAGSTFVVLKPGDRIDLEVQKNFPVHEEDITTEKLELIK